MKSLCRAFRLAFILKALWPAITSAESLFPIHPLSSKSPVHNLLEHQPVKISDCRNIPPTGPIDTTCCDYETVEGVNDDLFDNLHELVKTPFFKYFQIDLYRECPFWDDDGSCSDPGCAITSIDESTIPEKWRATALSKLDFAVIDDRHQSAGCYYRDTDFCFLDDNTEGDYYDLSLIPERYTGYSGPDTARIWRSIYEENCFGLSERSVSSGHPPVLPGSLTDGLREDAADSDTCLEKKVYYKVISGLHASISTHICLEWLNQTTGEWGPNLQCFVNRIASYPERLQNIYFNAVLLLRAVARIGPYLSSYDYCASENHQDDLETKVMLEKVVSIAQDVGRFDETLLFQGEDANVLKEEFKSHFRNVTRIMDCVGCDKCRLWGKVQTTGVATALKILFELDEKSMDPSLNTNLLSRSEVVALINTLHRFSESLHAVNVFRSMWSKIGGEESEEMIQRAAGKPQPSPLAGKNAHDNIFEDARMRFALLMRVCKDSTRGCVNLLVNMWRKALGTLTSVLKPSGKERGPGFGEF